MSALIEIDNISGMVHDRRAPEDVTLLPPDAWAPGIADGLMLAVDDELQAQFAEAELIAIDFPAFHDGRGLSLAVLLRTRFGFRGELRALGDVRPELLHYLRRCGFDSFLLAEGYSLAPEDPRLAPYSDYYQASTTEALPPYRRCRRGAYLRDS